MRSKHLISNLFLFFFGLVTALFLTEIGLRSWESISNHYVKQDEIDKRKEQTQKSIGVFEYDEELGWIGKAFASGPFNSGKRTVSVRINSHGLREDELSYNKKEETIRILVLGDSQTWGHGVEKKERYTEVLEELLKSSGISAEVMNFGVNGYGTDQEFLLLKRLGVQYEPDIVIVGFFWNDLWENLTPVAWGYSKPHFILNSNGEIELKNVPVPREKEGDQQLIDNQNSKGEDNIKERSSVGIIDWINQHSYTYRILSTAIKKFPAVYRVLIEFGIAGGPRRDPASTEWIITKHLLQMLKDTVIANGGEFLVVVIPEQADFQTAIHSLRKPLLDDMRDIPSLDLFPAIQEAGSSYNLYDNTGHLNTKGNAVVGNAIFDHLIKNSPVISANNF